MITEKELNISSESYIQKDFYQIYPSILELVNKITDRWDPSASNESDPGVVLLKLLAFIADKENYNIDKNILECFMPSATQESSMRKLCDMMGYDMHYYRSAETDVSFMWVKKETADEEGLPVEADQSNSHYIRIPELTPVTDASGEITYYTLEDVSLHYVYETRSVPAIQGVLKDVEINADNIVRLSNLDDNNRFYLPEIFVAENGIWINDSLSQSISEGKWRKVSNLNTQEVNSKVWKFGYDSRNNLPFIQFPDDVASVIGDGVKIKYVQTIGANGNISAKVLTKLSGTTNVKYYNGGDSEEDIEISDSNSNSFLVIQNISATLSGVDAETIDEAYNNFKKTIGTFDTLVTCRDYANKIYQLVESSVSNTPLVSNVQASDIRDDLYRSYRVMTLDEYGVTYLYKPVEVAGDESGDPKSPLISNFDLYLYPLNPIKDEYTDKTYINSFRPNTSNWYNILEQLEDYKTISHEIKLPTETDPYLIKNKYRLSARINTTYKVSQYEGEQILKNVYKSLYEKFNPRQLEYGEEIPYDTLLSTIQNADIRIKNVSLDYDITPYIMLADSKEYLLKNIPGSGVDIPTGTAWYFDLVAKNVLAGRVPLFDYDNRFEYSFGQKNVAGNDITGGEQKYAHGQESGSDTPDETYSITFIQTELNIPKSIIQDKYTLRQNETIQLISPSLATRDGMRYGAYINYYFDSNNDVTDNSEYELTTDDTLYINYADSDNKQHWLTITAQQIKDKETIIDQLSGDAKYIIKPVNFTLKKDMGINYSKSWAKILDQWPGASSSAEWSVLVDKGLYALGVDQEICVRDFIKAKLQNRTFAYWITDTKTITLTRIANTPTYEYVLSNDEYFMYTNEGKNTLVTQGPGTRLLYEVPDSENLSETITWTLPTDAEVSADQVAQKGIGAFADNNWRVFNFNSNTYLTLQEMQLINLGEGDSIEVEDLANGNEISNQWLELVASDKFKYNDNLLPGSNMSSMNWKVRSLLNLNSGPKLTQTLSDYPADAESGDDIVTQKIHLYTSSWKRDGEYIDPATDGFDNAVEEIYPTPINTFTNIGIKASYPIFKSGNGVGNYLSVHKYSSSGEEIDNLFIYPFEDETPEATAPGSQSPQTLHFNQYLNKYTMIDSKDYDKVTLPVFIPANEKGIITIYSQSESAVINSKSSNNNAATNAINFYYNKPWSDDSYTNELALNQKGKLYTIQVKEGCNLELTLSDGYVILADYAVTADKSGVNYNKLGLNDYTSSDCDNLVDIIHALDSEELFYYAAPVDNESCINVASLDNAYAWFDYNNKFNKFVLAQIDTDFSDVQITIASRLSSWK